MSDILLDVVRHTHWKSTTDTTSAAVEEVEFELGPEEWLELRQVDDKKGDLSREEKQPKQR